jgi:hypothetical protein
MSELNDLLSEYMETYTHGKTAFSTSDAYVPKLYRNPVNVVINNVTGKDNSNNPETAKPLVKTGNYSKNYSKLFTPSQYKAIEKKAAEWGKDPRAIAGIIWNESRGKTYAENANTRAAGIFQIMPSTAQGLGIDHSKIKDMSFDEQLELGGKYFKQYGKKWDNAQTATDIYKLVFYPAMIGKDKDWVLGSQNKISNADKIARQNKGFDLNKDGQITAGEFDDWGSTHFKLGGILYRK